MKIIYNNILPFPGFKVINLFGVLFIRKTAKERINNIVLNHEKIHTAQMKELGYIFFYIIYFLEWLIRLIISLFTHENAYKNIFFEREAYYNQFNLKYLDNRKKYNQWRKRTNKI